jgi:tripartite-type tricarboxylate transporter receptor subunit TctC
MVIRTLAALVAVFAACATALAQSYPSKPIRVVNPYPGGSATDTMFRVIAERMAARLGQAFVVEPKPGAGTALGTQAVIGQPADGYLLLVSTSAQAIKSGIAKPPFDIRKDLTHIGQAVGGPLYFAVNTEKVQARTLPEFIAFAKAQPAPVHLSSYGPGTLGHLVTELLAQTAGFRMTHVPFNGSSASVTALARGDVYAAFDVPVSLIPQVQAGRLRLLAASTAERSPVFPDLPGMRESGFAQVDVSFWQGLSGPAGLPREIVDKLGQTLLAAMEDQSVVEYAKKVGAIRVPRNAEFLTALVNQEVAQWARVIREAKLDLE